MTVHGFRVDDVEILAARFSCAACGDSLRIEAAEPDATMGAISELAEVWWVAHMMPHLDAVELTVNGQARTWIPTG